MNFLPQRARHCAKSLTCFICFNPPITLDVEIKLLQNLGVSISEVVDVVSATLEKI